MVPTEETKQPLAVEATFLRWGCAYCIYCLCLLLVFDVVCFFSQMVPLCTGKHYVWDYFMLQQNGLFLQVDVAPTTGQEEHVAVQAILGGCCRYCLFFFNCRCIWLLSLPQFGNDVMTNQ